ncbi:NADH dehydrogenase [Platysternon megacephalum]|uniref:NADH dehydrogenase n=1 Tax=Platysternon megacephalum TaxID=55544 RepID=A0A4D9DH44_9SAUR|nr:NADH dehydrogenase [Platysternon megacephalum]
MSHPAESSRPSDEHGLGEFPVHADDTEPNALNPRNQSEPLRQGLERTWPSSQPLAQTRPEVSGTMSVGPVRPAPWETHRLRLEKAARQQAQSGSGRLSPPAQSNQTS